MVVVFDLDDTLVVEEAAAVAAFAATAAVAGARRAVDVPRLAVDARHSARGLWHAFGAHPYCRRIGISSWEGLWCRFEGDDPNLQALRAWAPAYRREAWRIALAEQGIDDGALAAELGERFGVERRARHEVFADVGPVLTELSRSHRLALLTNGASCLQREKLAASGLAGRFTTIVVSGDIAVGKPDPAAFALATGGEPAAMVGDSLYRDVDGARDAGLHAIWLNRRGERSDRDDVVEIATLAELPAALRRL